jgi:hypothetical protein
MAAFSQTGPGPAPCPIPQDGAGETNRPRPRPKSGERRRVRRPLRQDRLQVHGRNRDGSLRTPPKRARSARHDRRAEFLAGFPDRRLPQKTGQSGAPGGRVSSYGRPWRNGRGQRLRMRSLGARYPGA